jgi:hypothetical protein
MTSGCTTLLAQARLEEVEREFRAQVNAVSAAGLTPTYLDWHCLADGGRDDILDLTVVLAGEYGLAMRVWLEPGRQKLRRRGLPVVDYEFLISPQAHELLRQERITVIDYRTIQQAWTSRPVPFRSWRHIGFDACG